MTTCLHTLPRSRSAMLGENLCSLKCFSPFLGFACCGSSICTRYMFALTRGTLGTNLWIVYARMA